MAQNTPTIISNPKLANLLEEYKSLIGENDENHLFSESLTGNEIDVTSEFWDTSRIRLDYNNDVTYPINIQFKESNYVSPISRNKVVTSRYGWRKGRAHRGIDIDLVTGDSLYAMFDGVVRFASYSSGHGNTVVIRHFNGLETVYAHLSAYGVKENDSLVAGAYLGKGGATGNARGSHLHLEMYYKGVPVNPEYLLSFDENNEIRSQDIWITKTWTRPELHNSRRQSELELFSTEEDAIASMNKPPRVYIVKKGDTLSRISSRNQVSIAALCKSNHIRKNSTLRIGQKLIID
ncbi:peptidoglycan DD-metalloendopeptidase family protein [Xanthomarina sp. F1114]|uniref:peptidoglycan DD-metalloendopeptidase family protein n=1 Tax=Xanthomarina sp. F1114 TaxID=2996019 RepID=UPI00225E3BDA|nr:peptidoglycan DD-metalloendopeptidase family protein [Xanthomarina sp. F1114]MCX7549112.1 peptidoglycan DD-metalloendopeptidase family protein [Xanthomarina sp. F1114]